jgi:ABC-type nitrate/sulfonate/bicarbonate transport system ATPase subunit
VEEAIYLADRILVLSPRPTRIQASFKVEQPHPRKLSNPDLQRLKEDILSQLSL